MANSNKPGESRRTAINDPEDPILLEKQPLLIGSSSYAEEDPAGQVERPARAVPGPSFSLLPNEMITLILMNFTVTFAGKFALTSKAMHALTQKVPLYKAHIARERLAYYDRERAQNLEIRRYRASKVVQILGPNIVNEIVDILGFVVGTLLISLRLQEIITWAWLLVCAPMIPCFSRMLFFPIILQLLIWICDFEMSSRKLISKSGELYYEMYWSFFLSSRADRLKNSRLVFFHSIFFGVPLAVLLGIFKVQFQLDKLYWSIVAGILAIVAIISLGTLLGLVVKPSEKLVFGILTTFSIFLVASILMLGLKLDLPRFSDLNWFIATIPLLLLEILCAIIGVIITFKTLGTTRVFAFAIMALGPIEVAAFHVMILLINQYGLPIPYPAAFSALLLFECSFATFVLFLNFTC